jgi:hypothetical protein
MAFQCPTCGSRRLRFSNPRCWQESVLNWLGWYAARCRDCEARFLGHLLMPDSWLYAKCPRCYRTDLSTWDDRHIRPRTRTKIMLLLGAERMRCEACRCNFASFRPRKMWYRRGKPQELESSEAALLQKENGSK